MALLIHDRTKTDCVRMEFPSGPIESVYLERDATLRPCGTYDTGVLLLAMSGTIVIGPQECEPLRNAFVQGEAVDMGQFSPYLPFLVLLDNVRLIGHDRNARTVYSFRSCSEPRAFGG